MAITHELITRMAELRAEELEPTFEALKPLHTPKELPVEGDWLDQRSEWGQSVAEYKGSHPVRPAGSRRIIYLQLLGTFTNAQLKVALLTADYVERFFGLPVKLLDPLPASVIPAQARRNNPYTGQPQILTTYVLSQLLSPNRPPDAVALIAFTGEDLWPGEGWNFVFGEASLHERVGIWSLARNGDCSESDEAFQLCLRRTLATATHELSHMLSLSHCIAFECLMNGSNHREEADARPLEPCPACLQKLCWNLGCDPVLRYQQLLGFLTREQLARDAAAIQRDLEVLTAPSAGAASP